MPHPGTPATRPQPLVSLVFAVRDRPEQLAYCLGALAFQTAPASDFEVVVVDDASDRPTRDLLGALRPPFALRVVRRPTPAGRAAARNEGWRAAAGGVVVFLDGDILPQPTLVAEHRRLHAAWTGPGPLCVSGHPWLWRGAFTVAYPDFDPTQARDLAALAARDPGVGALLPPGWERAGRPIGLLPDRALATVEAAARRLGAPAPRDAGVRLWPQTAAPFLAFVTRDVSLRREVLTDTGGFCEDFRRYGLADWEYGYRLHRRGASFCCSFAASCLHQRHPGPPTRPLDNAANYGLLLRRHPEPEVALMALFPPWLDQGCYTRACRAYHHLRGAAPDLAAALEAELLEQAWGWAAWGRNPRGPAPTPPPRPPASESLALWRALRAPDVAELLRAARWLA